MRTRSGFHSYTKRSRSGGWAGKVGHQRLDRIRKLRNRVAHHEPILSRNLQQDYWDILDTVGWICPDTRLWVEETSTFLERFQRTIAPAPPTTPVPGNAVGGASPTP